MLNRVVLIGRLVRDPELRTTKTGKNVVAFSIAVDRRGRQGEGEQTADFFRVTAWERTADFVANYLSKGRLVAVEGRLETRKFVDKEGHNREVVEITADNVQGLDRPRDDAAPTAGAGAGGGGYRASVAPSESEYDPFADE